MKSHVFYGLLAGFILTTIATTDFEAIITYSFWEYAFILASIMLVMVVLAIVKRKKEQGGLLAFHEGMKTGLSVSLICALLLGVFVYFYFGFIRPEWVETKIPMLKTEIIKANQHLKANQVPLDMEEQIKNFRESRTPFKQSMVRLYAVLFIGGVFTLLSSLVLKKKE